MIRTAGRGNLARKNRPALELKLKPRHCGAWDVAAQAPQCLGLGLMSTCTNSTLRPPAQPMIDQDQGKHRLAHRHKPRQ